MSGTCTNTIGVFVIYQPKALLLQVDTKKLKWIIDRKPCFRICLNITIKLIKKNKGIISFLFTRFRMFYCVVIRRAPCGATSAAEFCTVLNGPFASYWFAKPSPGQPRASTPWTGFTSLPLHKNYGSPIPQASISKRGFIYCSYFSKISQWVEKVAWDNSHGELLSSQIRMLMLFRPFFLWFHLSSHKLKLTPS